MPYLPVLAFTDDKCNPWQVLCRQNKDGIDCWGWANQELHGWSLDDEHVLATYPLPPSFPNEDTELLTLKRSS